MEPHNEGEVAHPGFRNDDERFNEVLVLLTSESRLRASEIPAGEQFQVIVRRRHHGLFGRMLPEQHEYLQQMLKDMLRSGPIQLVIDYFDVDGLTFRMHQEVVA